jgi:hypothetical protein
MRSHFLTQYGRGALDVAGRCKRALGMGQQRLIVAREHEPARCSCEEHNPEHLLKILDLRAGELRQM